MDFPRILVLGATGQIGAVLRKYWLREQVVWQARHAADKPESWVLLDPLTQPDALARAATGCSAILCLAGVTPARAAAGGDMRGNAALAEAAVHASAATGGAASRATVFLASSAAVYGDQAGVLSEDSPLLAETTYGRAKIDMERRSATLGARLGVPVCALRIGNIAGLDAILGGWKPGFRLDQFADGRTPARSYIGVASLARVLGDLMLARDLPGALNIASPGTVEMGVLLDVAGLAWTPRPASDTAIAKVALSTTALARFTTLPEATDADALVEEWHA